MYYNICRNCGAHLDPGEICECELKKHETKSSENTQFGYKDKDINEKGGRK